MKIKFVGGILDGHEEDVGPESGWDRVGKCGVASPAGNIVEGYLAGPTVSDIVRFEKTDNLTLSPGESARVLKLNPAAWLWA